MAAPYQHMPGMLRPTHLRGGRVLLLGVVALVALGAAGLAYLQWKDALPKTTEAQASSHWLPPQRVQYQPEPPPPPPPAAPPAEDPMAERWAAMMKQMAQIQGELAALKQRPEPKPAPAKTTPAEPPKPQPKKHASMLYVQHTPKEEPVTATPTYTLAPGATKLACQVETVMNSDTGQTFTAKTLTPVYDTATGQHLLVPQQSTILGKYDGAGLLYGNERLPTLSLSLTLPNGNTVDLGESPVMNGAGMSGLVTDVNQHYGRLLGAVFIGGALRGGAMALQAGMAGGGPAGYVAAGIAQSGNQALNRTMGRAMDTRPTITVDAGELCQVILLKPLQLPAVQS